MQTDRPIRRVPAVRAEMQGIDHPDPGDRIEYRGDPATIQSHKAAPAVAVVHVEIPKVDRSNRMTFRLRIRSPDIRLAPDEAAPVGAAVIAADHVLGRG